MSTAAPNRRPGRWSSPWTELRNSPRFRDMPPILAVGLGVLVVGWSVFASLPWALLALGLGLVFLAPAMWVYFDARQAGMYSPLAWGAFAMFTSPIGVIVYCLVRPRRPIAGTCAGCSRTILEVFRACPYCGHGRPSAPDPTCRCEVCHEEIEREWRFCPYCASPRDPEAAAEPPFPGGDIA